MDFTHILVLTIGAYVLLTGYGLTRMRTRAVQYFVLVMLSSLSWVLTYYFELILPDLRDKVVVHLSRFIMLPWLPMLWLLTLRELVGAGTRLPRAFWWGLGVFNAIVVASAVTSLRHKFFQYGFVMEPVGPYGILTWTSGPVYVLQTFLANLVSWFSVILLAQVWRGASPLMRRQVVALIVVTLFPLVMNTLHAMGLSPTGALNLAPFTMAISTAGLAWIVFGAHSLDIVPVARGLVFDQMQELVFVVDARRRLADLNTVAVGALGRGWTGMVGRSVEAFPPQWRVVLEPGEAPGPVALLIAGEPHWFERSCQRLAGPQGSTAGWVCMLRDVTAQQNAQDALLRSERKLRLILDNIDEAVFVHRADGVLLTVNRRVVDLYGLADEDEALRYTILRDYSAPGQDPAVLSACWTRVVNGETVRIPHWRARRPKTGETFDVAVELRRIEGDAAQPLILATVTDITEDLRRERQEEEIRRFEEEHRRVRQQEMLIRDLHDGVGGILASIGLVSAITMKETDPARRAELLRNLSDLAMEGNTEVRGLMNTLESGELLWPDLFDEVRRHAAVIHDNHGIAVAVEVHSSAPEEGPGLFPGMSLFRIVREALNNAVKHSGAQQVAVTFGFGETSLRLAIADDGRGIPPNVQPLGRGLRNMRSRIEELGGTMQIDRDGGLRLVFAAPLPLAVPGLGVGGRPGLLPNQAGDVGREA